MKNSNIEGHSVYKKKIWEKINRLSDLKDFKEHPGLITKFKGGHFYKNFIDVSKLKKFEKFKSKKKIRMSVDTKSDLDFFNLSYEYLKMQNKKFNYANVQNLENLYKSNNSHVHQQKPFTKKQNIYLISSKSDKIGLGHYKRSLCLKREIEESFNSLVKLFLIKNNRDMSKLKKIKNNFLIVDLPENLSKKLFIKYKPKKSIFLDNTKSYKNILNIIPGIVAPKKNYLSGKKYLIINRDINLINQKIKNIENYNVVIPGGVSKVPDNIVKYCIKNKHEKFLFIINKKNNYKHLKSLIKNNIKFTENPKNFLEIVKLSKRQIIRHGVLTYEILAMKKKPFIWKFNETKKRIRDINYLEKKGLVNLFNELNFFNKKNLIEKKEIIPIGAQGLLKEIVRIVK